MPDLSELETLEHYFADHFDTVLFPVLAEHYLLQGDFERAHRVCEIGFDHHPEFVPGLFVEARTNLAEGDLRAAESNLKTVTELDPGHVQGFILLAEVQTALGRAQSTLKKAYSRVLQLDRQNEKALSWMGGRKSPSQVRPKRSSPRARKLVAPEPIQARPLPPAGWPDRSQAGREATPGGENLANLSITPQLATFTLMSILKSQELYEQALEVLSKMAQKEGADMDRIEEEKAKLEDLLTLRKEKE